LQGEFDGQLHSRRDLLGGTSADEPGDSL
jgi:hypothetical protein